MKEWWICLNRKNHIWAYLNHFNHLVKMVIYYDEMSTDNSERTIDLLS